jgi:hypothetical protein
MEKRARTGTWREAMNGRRLVPRAKRHHVVLTITHCWKTDGFGRFWRRASKRGTHWACLLTVAPSSCSGFSGQFETPVDARSRRLSARLVRNVGDGGNWNFTWDVWARFRSRKRGKGTQLSSSSTKVFSLLSGSRSSKASLQDSKNTSCTSIANSAPTSFSLILH